MSTESHIKLHKEAVDLHSQLLHCAEVSLATGDRDIADFYSAMCDAIAPALQLSQDIPSSENQTKGNSPQ